MKSRVMTITLLVLFVTSMAMMPNLHSLGAKNSEVDQTTTYPHRDSSPLSAYPQNYTQVSWDQGSRSDGWSNSWNHSYWEFGPTITYNVRNGTTSELITINDQIYLDGWFDLNLDVPDNAVSTDYWGIAFMGTWFNTSALEPSATQQEGVPDMTSEVSIFGIVVPSEDRWEVYSTQSGAFDNEGPPPELPVNWTLPDVFGPAVNPYLEINPAESSYTELSDKIQVTFSLKFNSSTIPGFYTLQAMALDENLNTVAESQHQDLSGRSVGISFDEVVSQVTGGFYTWTRQDDDGNPVYSATRGVDFNMTLDITGTNLDNASIIMNLPSKIRTQRVWDGPYTITETRTGVWTFDEDGGVFVYDISTEVNYTRQLSGLHLEDTIEYIENWIPVNYYNPWADMVIEEFAIYQMALVFDFDTGTFDTLLTYEHPNYQEDNGDWLWMPYRVYEPFPMDGSLPMTFELNTTTSSNTTIGDVQSITFRGHVGEDVLPSDNGEAIWMEPEVYNKEGKRLAATAYLPTATSSERLEYQSLQQLAVETPIAVVRLTHKDEPYDPNWMFQNDVAETFSVKATLQGGGEYLEDIDGAMFLMEAHEEDWGSEGTYDYTQISIVHVLAKIYEDGTSEIEVYNHTKRTEWGYGGHYEEQYVEISPGTFIVQSVYVEDFYWRELYWDFTKNDWTEEPLGIYQAETTMPVNYIDVSDISFNVTGNDLRVFFNVTPSVNLPEREYQWTFEFGNLTWVPDYTKPWGEHTVLGWVDQAMYSYVNDTDKLFIQTPWKSVHFRNNDTDELYESKKRPFIVIDGKEELVREYVEEHPDGYTEKRVVFDITNPTTGVKKYYYELLNGTKVNITTGRRAEIYNVSLNDGRSFLAFDNVTKWYNNPGGPDLYWMMALNGSPIIGDWSFWNLYTSEFKASTTVTRAGQIVYANNTIPINLKYEPIWVDDGHILFVLNSTNEIIDVWYDWGPDIWYFHYGGNLYILFDGPWSQQAYAGTVLSTSFVIGEFLTKYIAYYDDGTNKHPLPDPNTRVYNIYELDFQTPRAPYAKIDGAWYKVTYQTSYYSPYTYDFFTADVLGTTYNLTMWGVDPIEPWSPYDTQDQAWTSYANGTYWVPQLNFDGWSIAYGHRDPQSWTFIIDGWLDVSTGNFEMVHGNPVGQVYDSNPIPHVITKQGDGMTYNQSLRVLFFNITLANGTFFYSPYTDPDAKINYNPETESYEPEYYFMYTIYGEMKNWSDWMDFTIQLVNVTQTNSTHFFFDGAWRNITDYPYYYWDTDQQLWDWYPYENVIQDEYYFVQSIIDDTIYEIIPLDQDWDNKYNLPSFNFTLDDGTTWYNVTGRREMVYKPYTIWGEALKLDLKPLPVTVRTQQHSIIVGTPEFGLWDLRTWVQDKDTGAIDLDGDLSTTEDQYYVRNEYESTDTFNVTEEYLNIDIYWEPNNTLYGDEFVLNSRTGMVTFNWSFSWAENHIWYSAETGDMVDAAELQSIKDTLLLPNGFPKPGYWDIGWLGKNFTSDDLKAQAIEEGWDWVPEDTQTWSWLWWELDEHYASEVSNGTHTQETLIDLTYEFAGLFAWKDKAPTNNYMDIDTANFSRNELTHYWMPIDVESVIFETPGESWGNSSPTGEAYRPVDETIAFGVTFSNVTGLVFPFGNYSYWDWYAGQLTGSDFANFDERPAKADTTEFTIAVEFTGHINSTGLNYAEVKFDLAVGGWAVKPGGRSALDGYSLGIAFYSELTMTSTTGNPLVSYYYDQTGVPVANNQTIASSNYTMGTGATRVAMMNLGGVPYIWSKPQNTANTTVIAQTVPYDTFSAIYTSGGNSTATSFSVTTDQFFTLIGFKWWSGYRVFVDPVFVGYISTGQPDLSAPSVDGITEESIIEDDSEFLEIKVIVSDAGGSTIASVKIWDIDNNINYTATYNAVDDAWFAMIPRTNDTAYEFRYRVVVTDYAGNEGLSDIHTYSFADITTTPPLISIQSFAPYFPTSTDSVTIRATVQDVTGIDRVILQYRVNQGTWQNVTMTASGDTYTATIPPQPDESRVDFRIVAYDLNGNEAVSEVMSYDVSDTLPPLPADETVLMMLVGSFGTLILLSIALAIRRRGK